MILVLGLAEGTADGIASVSHAAAEMAEATRREPGCRDYAFSVEVGAPHRVRVTEVWENEAALKAHFGQPHTALFNAAISGVAFTRFEVKAYHGAEEVALSDLLA
jgi:quinol monooxygenase YgiN